MELCYLQLIPVICFSVKGFFFNLLTFHRFVEDIYVSVLLSQEKTLTPNQSQGQGKCSPQPFIH